ncbi:MAG: DUF4954 family protein [Paludibacteraceae bacterium]|nr:DUF4954 family protein [Paludibacteraceae bacterium]
MYRKLTSEEVAALQRQGCHAQDWQLIEVKEGFSTEYVSDVRFSGRVRLGVFSSEYVLPGGLPVHSGVQHATLHNVEVGDNVRIYNVHNYIANYKIGNGTCIENVNAILVDGATRFGNGVCVPVMNEGGGREIPIYDRMSAHLAYIMTLYRHRPQTLEQLHRMIDDYARRQESETGVIGENVRILNCGSIKNVRIGDCAQVIGVSVLKNGSINSNKWAPVKLGSGVKCNDFIISSGTEISDSTLISRCFVGQGCIFGKHYSALDSLFFSNCQGMHGEGTAIFAGPYTVTHHKSTLLIAGMFSFLNAGSGSNQSNHMYKLGPIHQGVAERGAKTTSDSYLLWPAKVGAFTLVMGRHSKHSDTSELPFSYLIENATESYLVPGVNLRSVGTIRDAQKWPKRDNRRDPDKLDQINFNLLSPYTIQKMWQGRLILQQIRRLSGETSEEYCYNNCRIRQSSLNKGIEYYTIGIAKFLGNSLISRLEKNPGFKSIEELRHVLKPDSNIGSGEWIDCGSLIAPKSEIIRLMDDIEAKRINNLDTIQQRFVEMHSAYYSYEWTWALEHLEQVWGCTYREVTTEQITNTVLQWKESVIKLDRLIYADAKKEFSLNAQTGFGIDGDQEQRMLDFENVRGTFESNSTVQEILAHIDRKSALGDRIIELLKKIK